MAIALTTKYTVQTILMANVLLALQDSHLLMTHVQMQLFRAKEQIRVVSVPNV